MSELDLNLLEREARALAADLLPTLDRPRVSRVRLRRARAYWTAARNFVDNRRLARQGREDLHPLYFIWTLLRTCNFSCSYCDDHRGSKYPDLPAAGALDTAQARRLLKIMRTRSPAVYFAGGEPMLRRDLPEITRAARDLDYYPILINTNGSIVDRRLKRKEWRSWLADTDIVIVSLDALDPDLLGRMWVTKKPLDVIRNVLLLRELSGPLGFKLMVNTVIQPGAVQHAVDVLDFANERGIGFCPVPVNIGPAVDQAVLTDPQYPALVSRILERKRLGHPIAGSARMLQRLLNAQPFTCRNTLKPHIDYDGRLQWPCKASVNQSPASVDVLEFDHVDALYEHAAGLVDPTGFHGPAPTQCGANCNWAQNYSTDAYAHGLTHPLDLLSDISSLLKAA